MKRYTVFVMLQPFHFSGRGVLVAIMVQAAAVTSFPHQDGVNRWVSTPNNSTILNLNGYS
jgi:hypothetical protein